MKIGKSVVLKAALVATLIVVVALTSFVFANRQDIRDSYERWRQGPLPQPVSWGDIQNTENSIVLPAKNAATNDAVTAVPPPVNHPQIAPPTSPPPSAPEPPKPAPTSPPPPAPEPPKSLPASANLKIIFIPQAPLQIWDKIHEDTCEEASMLMVKAYLDGETVITNQEMERRLQAVVAYENKTLGYFESTNAALTAEIMRVHLNLTKTVVVPLTTADDIRREIAAGHPVILPSSGKALNNPNFKNGGPVYHMLVVKGYMRDKFITNDPGTRKGADYVYDDKILWNAIADWTGSGVDATRKFMIVVR